MPLVRLIGAVLLVALLAPTAHAQAQGHEPTDEEAAVLDVIEQFFLAMTARDVEASRRVMLDDGQLFSLRARPDGHALQRLTHRQFYESLGRQEVTFIERIWDPTVLVDETVAVVWAPFDIYRDGAFMHCGVNGFMLALTDDGWQIASVVYTAEPEGCEPSPLGPLGSETTAALRLVPAHERTGYDPLLQDTRHAVLATLHAELRAMATADVELSRSLLLAEAQGVAVSRTDHGMRLGVQSNEEHFEWLATKEEAVLERVWEEQVLVHGPMAVVWAPYDFYVEGERSHCGTNVVSLVRQEGAWRIADWLWNVRMADCPPSPLGEAR